jgi:predicted YcjX-like family ATPase
MAKRYQRGKQNPYIEEEQTAQWPKDTKEVNIIRISKKNRQHNGQKTKDKQPSRSRRYQISNQNPYIEEQTAQWPKDTKEVNRIRISKKNRQHNGQKKRYKRTSNDLQSIHIKQTNTNATNNPG